MATVSQKKRTAVMTAANVEPGPQPRKARWRPFRWLVRFMLLVIVLAAVAPWLIAATSLRNWVAKQALRPRGNVTVGTASFGWFATPSLQQVVVRDEKNQEVLRLPNLNGDTTLWQLAWRPARLGSFVVEGAQLHLDLRDDGSNLEDVFADLLAPSPPNSKSSPPPKVSLELKNAAITVRDTVENREWHLEPLNLTVDIDPARPHPLLIHCDCEIPLKSQHGKLAVDLHTAGDAKDVAGRSAAGQDLSVQASDVPLPLFQPFLRRVLPGAVLDGWLAANVKGSWSGTGDGLVARIDGDVSATPVLFAAPTLMGRDALRLDRLVVPMHVAIADGSLQVDDLRVSSDVGEIAAKGSIPLADLSADDMLNKLLRENITAQGRIDLARLAKLLPSTLRVREGTEITGGEIAFGLKSTRDAKGQAWQGGVDSQNLTAVRDGRPIAWEKPFQTRFAVRETPKGPVVDDLTFESTFLRADAAGTPDDWSVRAEYDLAKLPAELEKFFDLGSLRLAGQGRADVNWKRASDGSSRGGARATVQQFEFGFDTWRADATALDVNVTGGATAGGVSIEQLDATGQQVRIAGPGVSISEPDARLTGAGDWDSAAQRLRLRPLHLRTTALAADSEDLTVALAERGLPAVIGTVALEGDLGHLQQWLSDPQSRPQWLIVGRMSARAELARQQSRQTVRLSSQLQQVALYDAAAASARNSADRHPAWQTARLDLSADAGYDAASDTVQISVLDVQSEFLRLKASGGIGHLSTTQETNLSGHVEYDLEELTPLLRPYLGTGVKATGRESREFSFKGTLAESAASAMSGKLVPIGAAAATPASAWKTWDAEGSFGWESLELYGLQIGKGELASRLKQGQVQIKPIDWQVSGGRLTLSPEFRPAASGLELILPSGPVMRDVRITPEMCSQGLKFVAPLVAEATRAQGSLSLETTGARIPLADPQAIAVNGRLAVHQLQVSPSRLAKDIIELAQQVKLLVAKQQPLVNAEQLTFLTMSDENIEYAVADRRVYHRGLTMQAGDVTIRTSGSVGFDDTLAIVVEVPIQDQWLGNGPLAGALKGQTVKLPVRGTFAKWEIDRQGFSQFAADMARGVAGNVIRDGINKGLERLLQPK